MEFAFFTQQIVRLLLPFIFQDGSHFVNYVDRSTFLCLIVVGGGGGVHIANLREKSPQVHLIIIRKLPKNNLPP